MMADEIESQSCNMYSYTRVYDATCGYEYIDRWLGYKPAMLLNNNGTTT